jgi:hypothetical protein
MIMKKVILSIVLMTAALNFSSCGKKCNAPDNVVSGLIVTDAIIYSTTGTSFPNGICDDSGDYGADAKVSFDGGFTRKNIDFNKYNLIWMDTYTNCDVGFDRGVKEDLVAGTVTYTVTVINGCGKCTEKYHSMNPVLTTKWSPSLTPVFVTL